MLKEIMIPVAAFAVTVAGASAFNGDWVEKVEGLTDSQKTAIEEVRVIHEEAKEKADALLESVGLDRDKMRELHMEMREGMKAKMAEVRATIEAKDYNAFVEVSKDSKFAGVIDSEEKFNLLVEAHELREAGQHDEAKKIMEELGLSTKMERGGGHGRGAMNDGE